MCAHYLFYSWKAVVLVYVCVSVCLALFGCVCVCVCLCLCVCVCSIVPMMQSVHSTTFILFLLLSIRPVKVLLNSTLNSFCSWLRLPITVSSVRVKI